MSMLNADVCQLAGNSHRAADDRILSPVHTTAHTALKVPRRSHALPTVFMVRQGVLMTDASLSIVGSGRMRTLARHSANSTVWTTNGCLALPYHCRQTLII